MNPTLQAYRERADNEAARLSEAIERVIRGCRLTASAENYAVIQDALQAYAAPSVAREYAKEVLFHTGCVGLENWRYINGPAGLDDDECQGVRDLAIDAGGFWVEDDYKCIFNNRFVAFEAFDTLGPEWTEDEKPCA